MNKNPINKNVAVTTPTEFRAEMYDPAYQLWFPGSQRRSRYGAQLDLDRMLKDFPRHNCRIVEIAATGSFQSPSSNSR